MKKNILNSFLEGVRDAMEPILYRSLNRDAFISLMRDMGWDLHAIVGDDVDEIYDAVTELISIVGSFEKIEIKTLDDLQQNFERIKSIYDLYDTIADFSAVDSESLLYFIQKFPVDIAVWQLFKKYPKVFSLLQNMRVLSPDTNIPNNSPVYQAKHIPRFYPERISQFVTDPKQALFDMFFTPDFSSPSDIVSLSDLVYRPIQEVMVGVDKMKVQAVHSPQSMFPYYTLDEAVFYSQLWFNWNIVDAQGLQVQTSFALEILREGFATGPGLGIYGQGGISFNKSLGNWRLNISSEIDGLVVVTEGGIDLTDNNGSQFNLALEFSRNNKVPIVLGFGEQSGIFFDDLSAKIELKSYTSQWELDIMANAVGKIKIDSANGDSFLSKITNGQGIDGDFDINIGYSSVRGFYLGLGAGLSTVIHIDKKILNIIEIGDMPIALEVTEEGLSLVAGVDIKVDFKGKFVFSFENMGLRTAIDFTADQKNIGIGDLSFKFKKPSGMGVKIDAGKVKGAGYIYIDEINESYKGYLYLNIADKFALTAIGMLQTTLPDNDDGYSFIGLITLDLPKAIPIAFGFYLIGVGGIIAINRDMDSDFLRSSVRTGALDNILYPEIDFENIDTTFDEVLSDLDSAFPVMEGRHSFAIMGKFNYAEKNDVTLDLGFLVSVPDPLKIGLAGVLHIRKPEDTGDKLRINAAFLALIDFGEKLFSLDVSIYDSVIAEMQVEGVLAARFGWGQLNRQFIISAGGFHPAYEVSDVFKIGTMRRISLIIRDEENLKLIVQFYTAVTSNTFQFGARADLYAALGPLSISAYLGFDALFNFDPFYFIVDVYLGVALKLNDKSLFSIALDLNIKGPKAYYVDGFAKFTLLFISKEFKIDKKFGQDEYEELEKVAVLPLLLDDLNKNSSWTTLEPFQDETISFVALDTTPGASLVLNTYGTLKIEENVVPLDLPINLFGEMGIEGPSFFNIGDVILNPGDASEEEISTVPIEDYFAPAQFITLGENEKLKSKSYELQVNGVELSGSQFEHQSANHVTTRVLEYEEKYREGFIPVEYEDVKNYKGRGNLGKIKSSLNTVKISGNDFEKSLEGASSAKSKKYRRTKRLLKRKNQVRLKPIEYSIVSRNDMTRKVGAITTHSRTKAELLLRNNMIGGKIDKEYAVATNHVEQTAVNVAS